MNGLVTKSTGSWYRVKVSDSSSVDARAIGKIRLGDSSRTNPVAVGDRVELKLSDEGDYTIVEVHPRKNYIIRKATKLSSHAQIIASNCDLAIIMTSIKQPTIKFGFIDRMLVTIQAYGIPVLIVFNKCDILDADELNYLQDLQTAYGSIGYESLAISVSTSNGMDELKAKLRDKITVITGPSGVGKSSLLTALNPSLDIKVNEVSMANEKGKHTTTFAEMHEVFDHTFVIDTPGLKSFGLIDMEASELKNYFPEMVRLSAGCKFYNCSHLIEPGCAVREAFQAGKYLWFRYENYMHLHQELVDEAKTSR